MNTTVMRDSNVGDQWIKEACAANPVQWVKSASGENTENFLSGPVRLSFCDALLEAKPQMRSDPNSRVAFSTSMLFTPFTDFTLFYAEYNRIAMAEFSSHYDKATRQFNGLDNPFFDQGTKTKFSGYTPGLLAMNTSSNFKPAVVDSRNNPVAPDRVYPGVWAIVCLNAYASGKNTPRKGPRFGLQSVMIIGDDQPLVGGGVDPKAVFAGVSIKPPVVQPSAAFGQPVPPPPGGNGPMGLYPKGHPLPTDDDDLSAFR